MEKQTLIFITGGARSGKSTFAEEYATAIANENGGNLHYIATCRPSDKEMKNRIYRHKLERKESGVKWKTWECPIDLLNLAPFFKNDDIVLLDCLTILLTNELFQNGFLEQTWNNRNYQENVVHSILMGINLIQESSKALVIVSNEVLNEPLNHTLTQTYGRLLGYLHQSIIMRAKKAYLIEAGIPILMKER